jgi:hypothetical protein
MSEQNPEQHPVSGDRVNADTGGSESFDAERDRLDWIENQQPVARRRFRDRIGLLAFLIVCITSICAIVVIHFVRHHGR